jgi:hypothetical protein
MTAKKFLNKLANGKSDIIQYLLDKLEELKINYCLIGGLAVNAYAEPVASLDLYIVIAVDDVERFTESVNEADFKTEKFKHSINLQHPDSNLRIQIQMDSRYQAFIKKASLKNVLGYEIKVAALEDVLKGKIWAYSDEERRKSKRQKDLADIMRFVETYSELYELLPDKINTIIRNI